MSLVSRREFDALIGHFDLGHPQIERLWQDFTEVCDERLFQLDWDCMDVLNWYEEEYTDDEQDILEEKQQATLADHQWMQEQLSNYMLKKLWKYCEELIEECKRCPRCSQVKPRTEFYVRTKARDGLQSVCKVCTKELVAAWQEANPERKRQNEAHWHAANREKMRAYHREYKREYRRKRKKGPDA